MTVILTGKRASKESVQANGPNMPGMLEQNKNRIIGIRGLEKEKVLVDSANKDSKPLEEITVDFANNGHVSYKVFSALPGNCPFTPLERIEFGFESDKEREASMAELKFKENGGFLQKVLERLGIDVGALPGPKDYKVTRWVYAKEEGKRI